MTMFNITQGTWPFQSRMAEMYFHKLERISFLFHTNSKIFTILAEIASV